MSFNSSTSATTSDTTNKESSSTSNDTSTENSSLKISSSSKGESQDSSLSLNASKDGSQSQSISSSSSSGKSVDSQATLPIEIDHADFQDVEDELSSAWGILTAVDSNIFRTMKLTQNKSYCVGRDEKCDYCLSRSDGFNRSEKLINSYLSFSKVHFIVYKEVDSQSDIGFTVFIKDVSTNGTFVNGELLGNGVTRPLLTCSKITMADTEAFIFINPQQQKRELRLLPSEFKTKYVLENVRLGEGAAGVVRRGRVKCNGFKVAVKIITKGKSLSVIRDLTYEASLMQQIDHANIVKVLDVYEADHAVYIILECVNGGELFDYVKNNGKIPEPTCKVWFLQLLEALDYLHSKGVIHRDLKPENVLLTTKDVNATLKITDFGLSRIVSEQSLLKTLVGTSFYLAPEIIAPTCRGYTNAVDLWSMGCILYIMLVGYPPFSDDGEIPLNQLILTGNYQFHEEKWNCISYNAKSLVKGLLTVDPNKRITLSNALTHPWFTTTGNTVTGDVPTGNTVTGDTTSNNIVTGDTTSGSTVTGNIVTGDVPTGNTVTGNTTTGNTVTGNTTSGNTVTGNTTTSDTANGDVSEPSAKRRRYADE